MIVNWHTVNSQLLLATNNWNAINNHKIIVPVSPIFITKAHTI